MDSIGAFDAKTRLSELLERASRGEVIQITRHGKPVARLNGILSLCDGSSRKKHRNDC